MADIYTKNKRSEIMSLVRSQGNKSTELEVVRLFRLHGIKGWRRHLPLPGKPDFTFRKQHVIVFVDGCFWHGCSIHYKLPKSNSEFWEEKIRNNKKRDRRVSKQLRAKGWTVLRFWQHDVRKNSARVVSRLRRALDHQ